MKSIALFDLDYTITTKDTMIEFLKFTHGPIRFWILIILLSPILVLFKLGIIPNWKAKSYVLSAFYKGWEKEKLDYFGQDFATNKIPLMLNPIAFEKVLWHKKNNHKVVIVTASLNIWVIAWTQKIGIELLSTIPEFKESIFTGKLSTPNCYGNEKVNRILKRHNLEDYVDIYAYGDSKSDLPMIELANHKFYKQFQ